MGTQRKEALVIGMMEEGIREGAVLVFPSEASRREYLSAYAREKGAVLGRSALSADTFFELFQPDAGKKTKANWLTRQAFVHGSLPTLSWFLRPDMPAASREKTLGYLAGILPQLCMLVTSEAFASLPSGLQHDYQALYGAYRAFLDRYQLYEPQWEAPSVPADHGTYHVLFSNATLGFQALYEKLGKPDWIVPVPAPTDIPKPPVIHYPNFVAEIRSTLRRVKQLLDSGVPARDILISTAREDVMVPRLLVEARRYGVPLVVHQGLTLQWFPAARVFRDFQQLWQGGFTYEDMEALLLDPGIPWKEDEAEVHRTLLARAVDLAIDAGAQNDEDDLWLLRLAEGDRQGDRKLRSWYWKFKQVVKAIATSDQVGGFRSAYHQWEDLYLLPEKWNTNGQGDVATFCIQHLETMAETLDSVGFGTYGGGVLSWYLSYLGQLTYVAQQKDAGGVDVYRWTDSGSQSRPHHFLLALDWDGSKCVRRPLSCLPDATDDSLKQEEDLTEGNLDASCRDDGVVVSWHSSNYTGECMASQWFEKQEEGLLMQEDPWVDEEAFWNAEGKGGDFHPTAIQEASWKQACASGLLQASSKPAYSIQLSGDRPLPKISPSALDKYLTCPYLYAMKYLLGADQKYFSVTMLAPLLRGTMVHDAYLHFFEQFQHKVFLKENMESYKAGLTASLKAAIEKAYGKEGPTPFLRRWLESTYIGTCLKLLDAEAARFDDCTSPELEAEKECSVDVDGKEVTLYGRIDRVVRDEEGNLSVMDYKTGQAPLSGTGAKSKGDRYWKSLQLPIYNLLMADAVESALYYSVKDNKYTVVWEASAPGHKEDGKQMLYGKLEQLIRSFESGTFPMTSDRSHCLDCAWRSSCRRRYATL